MKLCSDCQWKVDHSQEGVDVTLCPSCSSLSPGVPVRLKDLIGLTDVGAEKQPGDDARSEEVAEVLHAENSTEFHDSSRAPLGEIETMNHLCMKISIHYEPTRQEAICELLDQISRILGVCVVIDDGFFVRAVSKGAERPVSPNDPS